MELNDGPPHYVPTRFTEMAGPMFGGAYIATSDSRLREAVETITGTRFYGAISLHDRFEA